MTSAPTLEDPASPESWTPQHWSREEWFYMWTKGLEPWRIARLCRVPYRKVYGHIHSRVSSQPERFGQRLMLHDHPKLPPGGLKKPIPKVPWAERAEELVEFRRGHGRFPRGYLEGEQQLYSFLQHQRKQYRAGKLAEPRRSFLDEHVPGWLTPPKKEREEALWKRQIGLLELFLKRNKRRPSYKSAQEPTEKVLATWVTTQQRSRRLGTLRADRAAKLDQILPSVREGLQPPRD